VRTTVLIVDDHAAFRGRARALLEEEGFSVVGEAANGTSALSEALRLRPDIALVDIGLPDIDGFDVADGLRAAGTARVIVLVSGRSRADFGDRVGKSAADGFIAKADLCQESLAALLA